MEIRIEEEEDKCNQLMDDRKKFQQTVADLEDQYVNLTALCAECLVLTCDTTYVYCKSGKFVEEKT
jgi:aspartate/glutamate racemase